MPTFEVTTRDGAKYHVDVPEGVNPTDSIKQIEGMHQKAPTLGDVGEDVAKSAGIGVVRGAISQGGFKDLAERVGDWAGRKLGVQTPERAPQGGSLKDFLKSEVEDVARYGPAGAIPRPHFVQGAIENLTGQKFYEPKTKPGEYAQTFGEFIPGAATGPGGIVRKGITALTGALGSEGAGQATKGTTLEPFARIAGGFAGGFAGGVGAGVAGSQARNLVRPNLPAQLKGIDSNALDWAAKAAHADGLNDAQIAAQLQRLGPAGFLAEYGVNFRNDASWIAARDGTGKAAIFKGMEDRAAVSRQRVEDEVTQVAGPRYNMANILKNSIESRAAVSDPAYERYRGLQIHPTAELQELAKQADAAGALKAGLTKAAIQGKPGTEKFFMIGEGLHESLPYKSGLTAEGWDNVKRALDDKIQKALKDGRGDDVRILTGLKSRITDAIDNHPNPQVRGIYKEAREAFASHSAIMDARAEGQRVFDPRVRSDDLAPKFAGYSHPEQRAFLEGARDNIAMLMDHSVKGASDELKAGAFNRLIDPEGARKLAMLYGQQGGDRLTSAFKREWEFNANNTRITKGSESAARLASENKMTPGPTLVERARSADLARPLGLVGRHVEEASTARKAGQYERSRDAYAPLLMRQGEEAAMLARALARYRPREGLGEAMGREVAPGRIPQSLARTLMQTLPHMQ